MNKRAVERIRAVFAAASISCFVFIAWAWVNAFSFRTLSDILAQTGLAFVALAVLFQFRNSHVFLHRLSVVITAVPIFATIFYALLAGGLWIIGGAMLSGMLFDGANWSGPDASPLYWATNAVAYVGVLVVLLGLGYLFQVGRWSHGLFAVGNEQTFEAMYETLASPLVTLTLAVMTLHTMLSPVYSEMFARLLSG